MAAQLVVQRESALRWLLHLAEMVAAMLIGMEVLFGQATAIALAFGYPDFMRDLPVVATLVMAATMVVPMALWMEYRGHARRSTGGMAIAMLAPLVIVVPLGFAGVLTGHDLGSMYHMAMYAPMVGVMLYRRGEYARSHPEHQARVPLPADAWRQPAIPAARAAGT
jgi:hypothetical protein